ncbi:MAG: glycerol-3-phosphate dehydrogenase/oxidase [Acidimicrobiales bacterium]
MYDHPDGPPLTTPSFRRADALGRLASEPFDVLVIGGGITGAGVALDAASRGFRTALVEKDDFASGTSSKSSKLVHGGLRYLQQHEFRLVYENLAERQRLLDNAPHLVAPLPFLIPLFGRSGMVNAGVARVYRTALWAYDLTGGFRIGKLHERVTKDQALAHLPTLRTDRLVAGFLYWDACTDDARLTLAVVRTAVLDHGAVAVNHPRAVSLVTGDGGRVAGARVEAEDRGGEAGGGGVFDIRASVVVNAAGVWADEVCSLADHDGPDRIRPAKGIHITVPAAAFPCDIAAVIPVAHDHRSIFVVPWGDRVYLGTTDTGWDGPLDDPSCLPEDVDYILDAANAVVTRPITRADITGVWSGLRPLLAAGGEKHPPSEKTADLSRRHTVTESPSGVVTVTGGKLTTYRKMAQDTVDAVAGRLGRRSSACVTKNLLLRGAGAGAGGARRRATAKLGGIGGIRATAKLRGTRGDPAVGPEGGAGTAESTAIHLAGRFGTETTSVLAIAEGRPDLLLPLVSGLPYLSAEAVYAVREEMATSISDVLDRRTRARLHDARASASAASHVASLIGPELGWDADRRALEAEAYAAGIDHELRRAGLDPVMAGHGKDQADSQT